MIRPFTILAMLAAAGSGAYLFAVKHRAQVLDDQVAAVAQASRLDGQRIRVLQAQWALETDPARLNHLASQFTSLQPMKPAQLVALASLKEDLPQAGAAAPEANPEDDSPAFAPPMPMMAAIPEINGLPLPPDLPPPAPAGLPTPARLASLATVVPAVPAHASVSRLGASRLAANIPAPSAFYGQAVHHVYDPDAAYVPPNAEIRQAAITPPMPAYASHANAPLGAQVLPARAVTPAAFTPPPAKASVMDSGSALAMAADLAPPRPLDDNN